ncbi:MAG: gamma-glutamyltransferase [Proteobacteria bacterium]|nr:gamma-glutamyltransferase [Pseudomonadota bacterium]
MPRQRRARRRARFPATVGRHVTRLMTVAALLIGAAGALADEVVSRHGMVATQEKRATQVGAEILRRGGNAVDAAVAVGFALAVTLPKAGNLGGGGFMLVHLARSRRDIAIDYRETAPAAATRDMFLNAAGAADPDKSRASGLGVGVPGTVAGLVLAHARFGSGRLTLAELIAPAIRLAREGVALEDDLHDSLLLAAPKLARWPTSAAIFLAPDGGVPPPGAMLRQPDLAATLEAIARNGARGFYGGPVAEKIAAAVRAAGGRMSGDDLRTYRARLRAPVRGRYRGHTILSMPLPSSGGVHLIEMLNVLERFALRHMGARSPQALHVMIEAMKLAYADRAEFMGDVAGVPIARLTSRRYARGLARRIDLARATPSAAIRPRGAALREGDNTTHFSIVDRFGNAVANTYTLNLNYGLGLVAAGTGVLLNNELDDFAAKPGAPNAFGLIGGEANAPGPGKRPLSSMSPTIVLKNGRVVLVTGAPGGSRIITGVLQIIVNVIDHRMPLARAVAAPRVHHQWMPDEVVVEPGIAPEVIAELRRRGHHVRVGPNFGTANSVAVTPRGLVGAADPRVRGTFARGP